MVNFCHRIHSIFEYLSPMNPDWAVPGFCKHREVYVEEGEDCQAACVCQSIPETCILTQLQHHCCVWLHSILQTSYTNKGKPDSYMKTIRGGLNTESWNDVCADPALDSPLLAGSRACREDTSQLRKVSMLGMLMDTLPAAPGWIRRYVRKFKLTANATCNTDMSYNLWVKLTRGVYMYIHIRTICVHYSITELSYAIALEHRCFIPAS